MQKSDAKDSLQGYIVLISSLFVFFFNHFGTVACM